MPRSVDDYERDLTTVAYLLRDARWRKHKKHERLLLDLFRAVSGALDEAREEEGWRVGSAVEEVIRGLRQADGQGPENKLPA